MIGEAVFSILVSSIEVGAGLGFLYFLYTLWCDVRRSI